MAAIRGTTCSPVDARWTAATLASHKGNKPRLTLQAFVIVTVMAAAIGGAVWLFSYSRQMQKQQDLERRVQARKREWTYNGERDGRVDYRFDGRSTRGRMVDVVRQRPRRQVPDTQGVLEIGQRSHRRSYRW